MVAAGVQMVENMRNRIVHKFFIDKIICLEYNETKRSTNDKKDKKFMYVDGYVRKE